MKVVSRKTQSAIATSILLLALLALWVYKFPLLQLPFYYDEAWSYGEAVFTMYKNHLCLTPGCLSADLSRGHPLWFYFMNAAVAKLFGFSPFALHLFSLIVSSVFLFVFFFILRRFTNPAFALLGTLLLLVQEVFIVQSSFMLPEIFIAMMTMVVIICAFSGRTILYFFSASILALTKESGLAIIAGVCAAAFTVTIKNQVQHRTKTFSWMVKYFLILTSPLLTGLAFYVLQKQTCGWYFFPEHTKVIDVSWHGVLQHLLLIRDFVFMGYDRKHLVLLSVLIIVLLFIYLPRSKTPLPTRILKITWFMFSVFVFYLLFSLINFMVLRYLILFIVIFIFLLTLWSYQLHQSGFRLFPYLFCLAIAFSLYHDFTFDPTWIDDVSINYKDELEVHRQAIDLMENNHAQSKKIFTQFILKCDLTHPEFFYLHGAAFKDVHIDTLVKDADYYIFYNVMLVDSHYDYARTNDSLRLMKKFVKGKAWCEVYERKESNNSSTPQFISH